MEEWIIATITSLGHWGIAFLMFLENVFPPIPSELIMPLAGFTAASGKLSLWGVVVAGSIGSVAGQFPLYYLGRAVGEERVYRFADRYGKWAAVSGEDVERAAAWLRRHGPIAVFLCRFVPGIRSLISIPAGAAGMNVVVFTAYSAPGISLWSAFLAGLGFLLGENYERVEEILGPVGKWVLVLLALVLLGWIVWRRRRGNPHDLADGPPPDEDKPA